MDQLAKQILETQHQVVVENVEHLIQNTAITYDPKDGSILTVGGLPYRFVFDDFKTLATAAIANNSVEGGSSCYVAGNNGRFWELSVYDDLITIDAVTGESGSPLKRVHMGLAQNTATDTVPPSATYMVSGASIELMEAKPPSNEIETFAKDPNYSHGIEFMGEFLLKVA